MDSYHKVVVPQKRSQENEIFVNSKSPASHLLSRVIALFKEKDFKEVTFRATGGAISTAVTVAELTKRRVEGLHQITTIGTTDVSSVFEPTIEGLDKHEQTRLVSSIVIKLSLDALDAKAIGYQAPLSAAEFKAAQEFNRPQRTGPPRPRQEGQRAPRNAQNAQGEQGETATSSSAPGEQNSDNQQNRSRGPRGPRRGGRGPRGPRPDGAPADGEHTEQAPRQPRQGNGNGPRRGSNGPRRGAPRNNGPRRTGSNNAAPSNAAPTTAQ